MPVSNKLSHLSNLTATDLITASIYLTTLYTIYTLASIIYTAYLGPLRHFPGPHIRRLSRLPEFLSVYKGDAVRDALALHAKFGPVVRISPKALSYAGSAQTWKDIYGFRSKNGQAPNIAKDPFFYRPPFNGVAALITADDANHSRQRKLISHTFADKTLKDLEPLLKTWVEKMRVKLDEKMRAGEKVDILKMYNCTTFDIMGDLSFNEGLDMLENGEYSSWVQAIFGGIKNAAQIRAFKMINGFTNWFVVRFLERNQKLRVKLAEHWNYSKERVDRRLAKTPSRPDLWTKILEKSKGPDGLTVGEHHSNASLFMVAGTETTATALSGTTYHLLQNPEYLSLLTHEIRSAFSRSEDISLEAIQSLPYLHAVLREGLRMYPPVPSLLPRVVLPGGTLIDDTFVPAGTSVGITQLATYRNEKNFADPYAFRPERWLGRDPKFANDRLDSLEPFSVGPRNCIGKNLAWHEMRLILATALFNFDLKLCGESEGWADQKVYTLWEKKALVCELSEVKRDDD